MLINRLALGTAQLGLEYGIANRRGKLTREDAFAALESARKKGIDTLDTAYVYGESEAVIGEYFLRFPGNFNIISKLPRLDHYDAQTVDNYFSESLSRLKQPRIYGYLVHDSAAIAANVDLWRNMESIKRKKRVDKIGVSIYRPEELEYLLVKRIPFDILQVPYSIFDQRFASYFPELKKRKVETYIRSVFLQGLFFLKEDNAGKDFQPAREAIRNLRKISKDHGIPINALCLCFALLNPFTDKVIIGVDSPEQLNQNINSLGHFDKVKKICGLLKSLELQDEEILLPYKWK